MQTTKPTTMTARLSWFVVALLLSCTCLPSSCSASEATPLQGPQGKNFISRVLERLSSTPTDNALIGGLFDDQQERHHVVGDDDGSDGTMTARELCSSPSLTCKKDYEVVVPAGKKIFAKQLYKDVTACSGATIEGFDVNPQIAEHKGSVKVILTARDNKGNTRSCSTIVRVVPCGDEPDCARCNTKKQQCRKKAPPVCSGNAKLCGSTYNRCCDELECRNIGSGKIDPSTGKPEKACFPKAKIEPDDQCNKKARRCDNNPYDCCDADRVCREPTRNPNNIKKCLLPLAKAKCQKAGYLCGKGHGGCCTDEGLKCVVVGKDKTTGKPLRGCVVEDECIAANVRCDNKGANPTCCDENHVCRKPKKNSKISKCLPPRKSPRDKDCDGRICGKGYPPCCDPRYKCKKVGSDIDPKTGMRLRACVLN